MNAAEAVAAVESLEMPKDELACSLPDGIVGGYRERFF